MSDASGYDWQHAHRWFIRDYATCRQDFLQQAGKLGADHRSWSAELAEPLYTDTLWIGAADAKQVLVLISGTHGVEGYCGSAIQRFLLEQWQTAGPTPWGQAAVLMIHALNPWGMHWSRRCDAEGIDLNRNFRDFSTPLAGSPDYPKLAAVLASSNAEQRQQGLAELREEWGDQHYQITLSGGQYSRPWAPFYGGLGPARAHRLIDELIAHYQLVGRELVVLDLHSGLGPWGYGELISDHPPDSAGEHYARKLFGAAIANTIAGESFSVPKQGLLDYRWHQLMEDRGCFLTLEFGSYPIEQLFQVLLNDHLQWRDQAPKQPNNPLATAMQQHFCPAERLWQQAVLFRARQCVEHVLIAFNHD